MIEEEGTILPLIPLLKHFPVPFHSSTLLRTPKFKRWLYKKMNTVHWNFEGKLVLGFHCMTSTKEERERERDSFPSLHQIPLLLSSFLASHSQLPTSPSQLPTVLILSTFSIPSSPYSFLRKQISAHYSQSDCYIRSASWRCWNVSLFGPQLTLPFKLHISRKRKDSELVILKLPSWKRSQDEVCSSTCAFASRQVTM